MGRNQRDESGALTAFAVTNRSIDHGLNCNENDDLATADVLGTLIEELGFLGVINSTAS